MRTAISDATNRNATPWAGLAFGAVAFLVFAATSQGEEPAALFIKACAPCHGKDGKAGTPMARKLGVKDLTQTKLGEAEIRKQVLEGKKGDNGLTKMPSFKDSLKSEEIEALVQYVRALQSPEKAEK